jgi:hypothetical protein
MKIPFEWHSFVKITYRDYTCTTKRAKIKDGWLVLHETINKEMNLMSESMIFISDPEHQWEI